MTDFTAKRTLVKSPPELWAELSEAESLAEHLGQFGEIRITRSEPQSTVAWEGEHASGTVELEESGWGTKVTLTASVEDGAPEPEPAPEPAPESEPADPRLTVEAPAAVAPDAPARSEGCGFLARWWRRRRRVETPERREAQYAPVMAAAISDGALTVVEKGRIARRPVEQPPREEEPGLGVEQAHTVLESTLDSLGSAHHRPFSRG